MKKIILLAFAGALLISALASVFYPRYDSPLQHSVYIWQRLWTPALLESLSHMKGNVHQLRVLAAEFSTDKKLATATVNFSALKDAGLPVYAVVRIDGRSDQQLTQATQTAIAKIAIHWQAQLPDLKGIEVDYDCPRSQLGNYANFLRELRTRLPISLALSNTALPDWLHSPELGTLLAQTDESVLQLHAVLQPTTGLFNADAALNWVKAYEKQNPKRFQVALPAYGSRVAFNADGKILSIESEQYTSYKFDHSLELEADPQTLAGFLSELKKINQLQVTWFRLPTAEDRRAWSLDTLQAVMAGEPLAAGWEITANPQLVDREATGLVHLEILNKGNIATALPRQLQVANSQCTAADGIGAYSVLPAQAGWLFNANQREKLLPQQRRQIGWLRCPPGISRDEFKIIVAQQ